MVRRSVVDTTYGKLQGYFTGFSMLFAGIPYAKAPVGDLRFRAPEKPEPWEGVRDATTFGKIQPQGASALDRFIGREVQERDEDSLFLNVWTPNPGSGRRPVYVFIHGGAWVTGSGSFPLYQGEKFAHRHDCVVVTINYRLAELGFMYLAHREPEFATSGNNGVLDAICALEWIRDNIEYFGGDPNNVTVAGESAGANQTFALMAAPRAAGLFHRTVCLSVPLITPLQTLEESAAITDQFFDIAGAQTVSDLQSMTSDELLQVRFQVQALNPQRYNLPWSAIVDNDVIPVQPIEAAASGGLAPVPLLLGSNYDDYRPFFSVTPPEFVPQNRESVIFSLGIFGIQDGAEVWDFYNDLLGPITPPELFNAAMNDFTFRQPTTRMAERHSQHQPTFVYDLRWESPVQDGALSAGHTLGIPMMLYNLWTPTTPFHMGGSPPIKLAQQFTDFCAAFARTSQPSAERMPRWEPYDTTRRATMALNLRSELDFDPSSERREFWINRL